MSKIYYNLTHRSYFEVSFMISQWYFFFSAGEGCSFIIHKIQCSHEHVPGFLSLLYPATAAQAVQTKLLAIPSPPDLFRWVQPSHRLYIFCFLYVLWPSNLFSKDRVYQLHVRFVSKAMYKVQTYNNHCYGSHEIEKKITPTDLHANHGYACVLLLNFRFHTNISLLVI